MIDIVVATYNRANLIPKTLESVQSQTYQKWRCWIAEDGQTAETLEAISPFLKDDRFLYLPGKHAGKPAYPRNRAILKGNAEFIAFLDDDDFWLPEKLQYQIEFMDSHPNCVLLGCNAYRSKSVSDWDSSTPQYFQKKAFFGRISYKSLVQDNYIILSSSMIRRSSLDRSGLFNEGLSVAEDYELWLRMGALGEIWNIPDPLLVYKDTEAAKHYPKLNRREKYRERARTLDSALTGCGNIKSPLLYEENKAYAEACRYERDFYLAGPRFLGRLRHEIALKIKNILS
jgi:glycosyltransferase involved in cell wall biosynthesis